MTESKPECILSFEQLTESVASLNVVQQPVSAILAANPSADVADVARQVVLSLAAYDDADAHPMSWSMDGRGRPPESSTSADVVVNPSAGSIFPDFMLDRGAEIGVSSESFGQVLPWCYDAVCACACYVCLYHYPIKHLVR
jgi:hypothetical protein